MITLLDKIADHCVGLHKDKAKEKIEKAGAVMRITEVDGQGLMVTAEYNARRINVDIARHFVVRARIG